MVSLGGADAVESGARTKPSSREPSWVRSGSWRQPGSPESFCCLLGLEERDSLSVSRLKAAERCKSSLAAVSCGRPSGSLAGLVVAEGVEMGSPGVV